MKTVSAESALVNVRKYLENDVVTPFVVVVDDNDEYSDILNGLNTLASLRVSDYCAKNDSYPDLDALCGCISTVTQKSLLLGLGESVSFSGDEDVIGKIKDLTLAAKVVVVCRGVRSTVNSLCADDKKFDGRRICFLKSGVNYEIIKFPPSLEVTAISGFKELLCRLENGGSGALYVKTSLPLNNTKEICSAYEAIRQIEPTFMVEQACLPDNLWTKFLADRNLEGFDLFHWRSFLKLKLEPPTNVYLKHVADTSTGYSAYKKRVFCALLDFATSDKQFSEMYTARKTLLKDVRDSDIAEYIAETQVKDSDRIYYLTDNTKAERQAVIKSLKDVIVIPDALKDICPALYDYLCDFSFTGEKGALLSCYFAEYKRLKLTNRLTPEFHQQVLDLAIDGSRPYNSLKTRGAVLDNLGKENTALYWIDALGVEYLGYIQSRASVLGLKIMIHVVRANLPTITSFNNDFYEAWIGDKAQTKALDKIKHEGEQGFDYQTIKTPVYLAEELRIIDDALDWAKTKLTGKNADKVVLISDHGASRLAVTNEQECKWEMTSKGEHSGRCCPCNEADVKSEYATEENGFWVLANYDRFKGGRKASIEVHGGATLEEVVIPLIEIELFDTKIEVSNTTPVTTASYKKNAEIILFSKSALNNVSIQVIGRRYYAETIGNNKHKVTFSDIKRSGKHVADVFEGDSLIGKVEFEIQRESGKTNDSDWF
ncbi:MAG: BREX-4 system phosphatase PglZ [Synergistaceae bacterium]|nr:BREX-4 system phosphatase PglZ [Synergistaceae bacterium]